MNPQCPGSNCWVHGGGVPEESSNSVTPNSTLWARSLSAKKKLQDVALAQSTRKTYSRAWDNYLEFLRGCGKADQKDGNSVAAYLAHLAEKSQGLGGVDVARSALAHFFKLEGFSDRNNPAHAAQVDLVLKGAHRSYEQPTKKARAITPEELEAVVRAATGNLDWPSIPLVNFRLAAQLTLMYATAARYEEAKELRIEQLSIVEDGILVTFKKGKSYQFGENRHSVIADMPDLTLNPKKLLEEYLTRLKLEGKGGERDFLFPNLGSKKMAAVSYEAGMKQFRQFALQAGIPNPDRFTMHSLRRGSATTAANANVSTHLVTKHMRVSSETTVRRYATVSKKVLRDISKSVFKHE